MQQALGRPSEKNTGHTGCAPAQRACHSSWLKKLEEGLDHILVYQEQEFRDFFNIWSWKDEVVQKGITTLASKLL